VFIDHQILFFQWVEFDVYAPYKREEKYIFIRARL
jgi:hypothetical protein